MIEEERENIINNENTAQERFERIVETLTKPVKKIIIPEPLSGDIDLSSLKELGVGIPDEIIFQKGKITNLYNIPEGLLILECPANLLISIDNLPVTIQNISVANNHLSSIDITPLTNLEYLNVSHNQIKELNNIPDTLKELRCNNNKLSSLNLIGLSVLKTLHISNNMITVIENMPDGVEDFQMENTPSIEFRNQEGDDISLSSPENEELKLKKKDYVNALNEFFKIKSKYENKHHDMRKKAYKKADTKKMAREAVNQIVPPCIKCKRPVGSIFSMKGKKYSVICGDAKEPCKLNIQLFSGDYISKEDAVNLFQHDTSNLQTDITRNRLNNIFDYIDDETSKQIYNEKLKEYNVENDVYTALLDSYKDTFDNKEKKKEIIEKKRELYSLVDNNKNLLEEYKETNNTELIKEVVKANVQDVYRVARNIRNLEHEIMEMNFYKDKGNIHKTFQYPVTLQKREYNLSGEPSSIIKFDR